VRELLRRCGPIWLTFAAAHAVAARRGEPRDCGRSRGCGATEIATDPLWSRSPGFASRPGARRALRLAGAGNLALAVAFARRARAHGVGQPV
jgi:hypothetical protein